MASIQNTTKPVQKQNTSKLASTFFKNSKHSVLVNSSQPPNLSTQMSPSNYEIQLNQSYQEQQANYQDFSIYEEKTQQLHHCYHLSKPQSKLPPLEREAELSAYGKCAQQRSTSSSAILANATANTQIPSHFNKSHSMLITHNFGNNSEESSLLPAIPPLPINYQKSDGNFLQNFTNKSIKTIIHFVFINCINLSTLLFVDDVSIATSREQKRQRAISKLVRQAELKRLRIAQEIQREQEEIDLQLKELEGRGVNIEKTLRGETQHIHK